MEGFTVNDARELTMKAIKKKREKSLNELEKILESIKKACNDGRTEYYYFGYLNKDITTALLNLGFDVEEFKSVYNDINTTISW